MIRDTKPDAVYILHEVNHLSPSIIRAARKEKVVLYIEFQIFLCFVQNMISYAKMKYAKPALHGDYRKAIEHRCAKGLKSRYTLEELGNEVVCSY